MGKNPQAQRKDLKKRRKHRAVRDGEKCSTKECVKMEKQWLAVDKEETEGKQHC